MIDTENILAHKLTALRQTKLKKNCVISSKTCEVMMVLVFFEVGDLSVTLK